jgi:hypothetical protein
MWSVKARLTSELTRGLSLLGTSHCLSYCDFVLQSHTHRKQLLMEMQKFRFCTRYLSGNTLVVYSYSWDSLFKMSGKFVHRCLSLFPCFIHWYVGTEDIFRLAWLQLSDARSSFCVELFHSHWGDISARNPVIIITGYCLVLISIHRWHVLLYQSVWKHRMLGELKIRIWRATDWLV